MQEEKKGLCFRCEHRARFFETGSGPRYECQQPDMAVHGCYMYKPVKPCVLKKDKDDKRPRFAGALFSARERYAGIAPVNECDIKEIKEGTILYWKL